MADNTFIIKQKINESTTTAVFRAHQEALDRTVILKVLHKHLAADEDFIARFRREARACAAIHSGNIVQVYDFTEIDNAPAIVMEYVEGKSLKELLVDEGKQKLEFVSHVVNEVLKGLSVAHKAGIIHRDIKPGNILISSSGRIMLTDFGLASFQQSPVVTMDGVILGTLAYMSPEQARGEVLDERTDLFSLGVTIVELLTQRRIFEGNSYQECMKRISSFSIKDIEQLTADLPADFVSFLCKLLAPQKEDRFSSAQEALQYLKSEKTKVHRTKNKITHVVIPVVGIVIVVMIILITILSRKNQTEMSDGLHPLQQPTTVHVPSTIDTTAVSLSGKVKQKESKTPAPIIHATIPTASGSIKGDSGKLIITCVPWGMVYVDDVCVGQTPLSHPISVKAGTSTIMFSNPLFVPIRRIVNVAADSQLNVEENFLNYAGYLVIRANPWADIYVDEQYRGTTPLNKPLMISGGTRKIRLHNPAYDDMIYDAKIKKGDTLNLAFTFPGREHR